MAAPEHAFHAAGCCRGFMGVFMKLAICDDEKDIRNYLEKCVREVSSDVEILTFSIRNTDARARNSRGGSL